MPLNSDAKLPSWAKVVKPKSLPSSFSAKREPLTTQEEEAYIRTRCFHILSKQMDHAMEEVLTEGLAPCLASLEQFLDAALPTISKEGNTGDETTTTSRKRPRMAAWSPLVNTNNNNNTQSNLMIQGLDISLFDQQQEVNAPAQDPLLLPVMVLQQGPSFGLDRQEQVQHLVQSLQQNRKRAAVVHLQPQPSSRGGRSAARNSNSTAGAWMQALTRQCHQQYPILATEPLCRRILKRQKKKAVTCSDLLLLWATHVSCFDEIVVFLDAGDRLYSAALQDFLHLLSAQRAEHGLPISVILLGPQEGRRNMELRSSLQGYAGFALRSLALAPPNQLLERFWQSLCVKQSFPVMFPPLVLAAFQSSFLYHQRSASRTLAKFKQALAYFFTQRGSFMLVANDKAVLNELWQRIAYCFVERRVRPLLVGNIQDHSSERLVQAMEAIDSRHQKAKVVLELSKAVKAAAAVNNNKHNTDNLFDTSFLQQLRSFSQEELLKLLFQMRQQTQTLLQQSTSDSVMMRHPEVVSNEEETSRFLFTKNVKGKSYGRVADESSKKYKACQIQIRLDFLNELIVLVGKNRYGGDLGEIEEYMDRKVAAWMFNQSSGDNCDDQSAWTSHPPEYDWQAATESLFVSEPRRQTVAALLRISQLDGNSGNTSIAHVAGTMYHLISDRVAVPQEEWYEEFWQKAILQTASGYSREDSFALFSLGLRYLKQCGLIAEKLRVGSRSAIVYERVQLVWCSGD